MKTSRKNPFRNLSLRAQMLLGGILILLIPMIIIGTVTFITSSRTLEDISNVQLVQIAQNIADMIRIPLEKDLRVLKGLASDPEVIAETLLKKYPSTQHKLTDLFQLLSVDYEGLAIVDPEGIVRVDGVDKKRIGISVASRHYFQEARKGKTSIGTLVYSKATGNPVFVVCVPIKSANGDFIGGVIGVARADFLMRYIASIKLGKTGYAFIVDGQGGVIAHPVEERILSVNLRQEAGLERIARDMIDQRTGTAEYIYDGIHKVAGFTPVGLGGWSIAVTQNKNEIMALAYMNRNFILLVSGIFIALTILAVYLFSRSISEPVQSTLTTLNQAIEQATEAFIIIDHSGIVQFVNPAMAAIIDQPIETLIGGPLQFNGQDDNGRKEIWKTIGEGNVWSGHITGKKKDNVRYTLNLTITPVFGSTGKLNCYLAVGRDISNELMMQERIQQSQKMEAIGTLAGGIAHDFNNILSAIFGYTELAFNNMANRNKLSGYLTEILNAAKRAGDLVNHILTFSRKTDLDQKPIIPKYVIKEALKLLRASLPSTIEIRDSIKGSSAVLGDPTQIHQITMNLCANAGYAMREHGGILEVSLEDVKIDEDFLPRHPEAVPGDYLRLRVTDSGEGIPPDILDRIFDPFYTTKPTGEGTGLGLSAVHGIVNSMNGIIDVASEPGTGTAFTIYLPIVETEFHRVDQALQKQLPRGSERILWVDDESAITNSGEALLETLGYSVQTYTDSKASLDGFSKDPDAFDVVISDYTMPHMTGIELAGKIRKIRRDIPIIICSGYLSFQERVDGLEPVEFLKKPIATRDLAHLLRLVLDKSKGVA